MTYPDAIQFLYELRLFGTKFGLENTFRLAALAGNPQERLRFIHVAGTNGKGSTCAMLESIYRSAGLRVGLFTSPHLVSFAERIQVNRQLIPEADVARLVVEMQRLVKQFPESATPTFFEVVTLMALKYFVEQHCDLVIWETGMGGRLDATNIVRPLASVITNIGYDHQKWLGETLEKIAFEKAGIIKPNTPVITATTEATALEVIRQMARDNNAPLTLVTSVADVPSDIGLLGAHQQVNAAVACATVGALQSQIAVPEEIVREGLRKVRWPGRLQVIERESQRIVLDGAHNAAGAETLKLALPTLLSKPATLILGILGDKDFAQMCEVLAPIGKRVFLVPVQSERTARAEDLVPVCHAANPGAEIVACQNLADALERAKADEALVITGSLYLVGEALELLGVSAETKSERGLNERLQ